MNAPVDYRYLSTLWASPDHAGELARLHAELFDEAWDQASFEKLLAHPGAIALLARLGTPQQTAGFVLAQMAADQAEVLTVCVSKDRQRHGVGKRLIEALIRAARKSEIKRLYLEVAPSNSSALALYKSLGFTQVGVRKDYYKRPGGGS